MRLPLREVERDDATITLAATLPRSEHPISARYRTRLGALIRIDGVTAGAFDREHAEAIVPPRDRASDVTLQVERRSLPTNGLPSGPGLAWWLLNAGAREHPATVIEYSKEGDGIAEALVPANAEQTSDLALWGHAHLDVAWLWTYEQARRKAQRTFAIAAGLLERDPSFVFIQSQPQLYEFVRERDPELFARVQALARAGRFDADVAALWVECDCNLPSGESLLRQMLEANRYCNERFGYSPTIAWLPDSFGFANTLPLLLRHCGIARFATTKLQWNDTTRFPYPQFVWRAPDGSEVLGAVIAAYEGEIDARRAQVARSRGEPLIAGYGDGGGGVTRAMLAAAPAFGRWQRPRAWFNDLEKKRASLPVHSSELYLEYHRGVYTTHHDLKARNAALERRLADVEEQLAWCLAVRAPRNAIDELRARLNAAWRIVLRNQFHDVLPGTSIQEAMDDARAEYDQARELVERTAVAASAMLPRAAASASAARLVAPQADGSAYVFDNGLVHARVAGGKLVALGTCAADAVELAANALTLYRDRPKKWEAWNIDADYQRSARPVVAGDAKREGDALQYQFQLGSSPAVMLISLRAGERWLRVEMAVDWRERRTLLRVEQRFSFDCEAITFGSPHGTIARAARRSTPQQRAMFEVPGQRFARAQPAQGSGVALLSLDTYGWSAFPTSDGGLALGHSLLRGTGWPDPRADLGEQQFSWAFAPLPTGTGIGEIEQMWRRFAHEPSVRLFTSDDAAVLVTACKPAQDGDGIVVRVRECDGKNTELRLRCGGRMRDVVAIDGVEEPLDEPVRVEGESLTAPLPAYSLRSFRVRF